jgi:hypothetical protein
MQKRGKTTKIPGFLLFIAPLQTYCINDKILLLKITKVRQRTKMNYKIKNIACALTLLACQAGTSNLFAAGGAGRATKPKPTGFADLVAQAASAVAVGGSAYSTPTSDDSLKKCWDLIKITKSSTPSNISYTDMFKDLIDLYLEYFIVKAETDKSIQVLNDCLRLNKELTSYKSLIDLARNTEKTYPTTHQSIQRIFDRIFSFRNVDFERIPEKEIKFLADMNAIFKSKVLPVAHEGLTKIRDDINKALREVAEKEKISKKLLIKINDACNTLPPLVPLTVRGSRTHRK